MKSLIPRFKPNYSWKEFSVALCFWRDEIDIYEKEFSEKFGCKYGTMFAYGRSGLKALLESWNLKGKEVICPAYTCVVVPHAIVKSNNIPRFVDCSNDSFHMDYEKLERVINKNTAAIIVTHLFGEAMDVEKINSIVEIAENKYNTKIYVIQDVAHSYGVKFNNRCVASYGDAAIFGCNISKIINSIFGGMVITNNLETNKRLKVYQKQKMDKTSWGKELKRFLYLVASWIAFNKYVYYWVNFLDRKGYLNRFTKYYDEEIIDFPNDWNEYPKKIEARVGRVQLKKYEHIISSRRKAAKKIISELEKYPEIKIRNYNPNSTYSHLVATVKNPDEFINEYFHKGVQLGTIIDYSVPHMVAYGSCETKNFSRSYQYSKHIINFPLIEENYIVK